MKLMSVERKLGRIYLEEGDREGEGGGVMMNIR